MNYSKQREALLKVLKSTDTHPSAYWIYDELKKEIPNISLATVYRNLAKLAQNGEILKLGLSSDMERFDGSTKDHAHFVCNKCNSVLDIFDIDASPCFHAAQTELNCEISGYSLVFYGICSNCKEASQN